MTTVLIVEDNPVNMKLAAFILSQAGYTVLEAENAETGLALAREHRPPLVLMDVHLPGMDGIEALEIMRADPGLAHVKVYAITASAMKGDRERLLRAGFDGYMAKPFVRQRLLDEVAAALA